METRDDKLIALIGLLAACLIGILFIMTMTWLTDMERPAAELETSSCVLLSDQPTVKPAVAP